MIRKTHALYPLEKRRGTFLAIGFMLSLFLVLTAMEWRSEVILPTYELPEPPPPTPAPPPPPPKGPTEPPREPVEPTRPPEIDGTAEAEDAKAKEWEVDSIVWEDEEWGDVVIPDPPHDWSEFPPIFGTGEEDRIAYLEQHIRYPQRAIDARISGKVYVSYIVSERGKLQNIKLVRGIGGGCDKEVLRVVKAMPRWNPGMMGDQKVAVKGGMFFEFKLE
ncbi:MAG: energy transducer TonB [Flavobacteriales bacterium]|nr:energy transducer TonB [Flavobacteriales bacterium]